MSTIAEVKAALFDEWLKLDALKATITSPSGTYHDTATGKFTAKPGGAAGGKGGGGKKGGGGGGAAAEKPKGRGWGKGLPQGSVTLDKTQLGEAENMVSAFIKNNPIPDTKPADAMAFGKKADKMLGDLENKLYGEVGGAFKTRGEFYIGHLDVDSRVALNKTYQKAKDHFQAISDKIEIPVWKFI